jgi:diketogulonate reductase-like aldo/keto reductase
MSKSPLLTLNSGVEMPALGFGVYRSPPEQTSDAVECALSNGYRLIDTAAAYGNERQVGEGIRRSGIDRADVFVTTKLWISQYGYDEALRGFDASLRRLGLDYLDLYLLHWPLPSEFEQTVGAYKAAERLLSEGRVRAIGVCNHKPAHLDALMSRTDVVPAVNQIELHPYLTQVETREVDADLGIVTQAWSPIGGVNVYWDPNNSRDLLKHDVIVGSARKHGKTPAQVVLRWHIQHGVAAIPKSVHPGRIAENIDVFDFQLAEEEVAAIDALDTGVRGGPDPDQVDRARFVRAIED